MCRYWFNIWWLYILYIYPYLMVRPLSHYIKWYPHMISYFVYTVWIYMYIYINIYTYIYMVSYISLSWITMALLWLSFHGFSLGVWTSSARGSWLSTESATRKAACEQLQKVPRWEKSHGTLIEDGYGSIPINTIFRGMNIHLPAILMFKVLTHCQMMVTLW